MEAAKPESEKYRTYDIELKGFGFWIYPNGSKSYFFQYRGPSGRQRQPTIGKHGVLTPIAAREIARDWAIAVRQGRDPLDEKRKAREAQTVGELLDAYLASARFKEKAAKTKDTDRGRIENHLKPRLGGKIADKLTPDVVRKAAHEITEGKTARDKEKIGWRAVSHVKGGEGAARHSIRLLSTAYSWGIEEGLVSENPAKGIAGNGDGERSIVMRDADDYRRLFETLDRMENERRIRPAVADIFRIIALTGARRSEILGLERREVDLRRGVISIPANKHKTGKKSGSPRIIGLPSLAQAILSRQPAADPDALVFPPMRKDAKGRKYPVSRKGHEGRICVNNNWKTVREEAQLPEDIGLHGLRHSLATHMAMQGAQASEIMAALGHKKLATSQKYVHFAEDARAALAERAANMITNAAGGTPAAKVFDLESARK